MVGKPGQIRIIGGEWRGRKISVPDHVGLRPTPDRVRETLFNWLMQIVPGSRCLDLFAGAGALGLEAASRGAQSVDLVELDSKVAQGLREQVSNLGASKVRVHTQDAFNFLAQCQHSYEIVFLDPPFKLNLLGRCARALEDHGVLENSAWIYLEADQATELEGLPANWQPHRHKKAGQVGYHLFHRESDS